MSIWRERVVTTFSGLLFACGCGLPSEAWSAATRALIATGLGGSSEYATEFEQQATRIGKQLTRVSDDVTILVADEADARAVQSALNAIVGRSSVDDALIFVYVGHGTYNGEAFKFNVIGADFTAEDLAGWLEPAQARRQLVVVTGASSGAVQNVLAADGRTVMTGTRSGEQRNATVFGRFFSGALANDAADTDKDQRITALEAFRYAESGINAYYAGNNEMTTENPVVSGPDPVMVLAHLETMPTLNPELEYLLGRREALELEVANLRSNKSDYTSDEYFAELQRLLLELAMIDAEASESSAATP